MTLQRRLFSVEPLEGSGDVVRLDRGESHHGAHVMRLKPGDRVTVFDETGRQHEATVERFESDSLHLALGEPSAPAPETRLPIILCLALVKGPAFEATLQRAVELGVTEIVPVATERSLSIVSDDRRIAGKMARWRQILLSATKQCGRARLTAIVPPCAFAAALTRFEAGTLRLCCAADPGAARLSEAVRELQTPSLQSVAVLIGPEGGFSSHEIEMARREGWRVVSLGPRTLRVETAAAAALTLILSGLGEI